MARTVVSPQQIAANRRNARKSTGPRTSAGKARTRLNALRAGDLARACLSPLAGQPANSADFSRLLRALRAQFNPRTPIENFLVERFAQTIARLVQAQRCQSACIRRRRSAASPSADPSPDRSAMPNNARLTTLIRYENNVAREFQKLLGLLVQLRDRAADAAPDSGGPRKKVKETNPNVIPTSRPQPPQKRASPSRKAPKTRP